MGFAVAVSRFALRKLWPIPIRRAFQDANRLRQEVDSPSSARRDSFRSAIGYLPTLPQPECRSPLSLRFLLIGYAAFSWQAQRCIAIALVLVDPLPAASPGTVLRANRLQA